MSSFSALQQDLGGRGGKLVSGKSLYYAFDLMHLDGRDLMPLPLLERKEALSALLAEHRTSGCDTASTSRATATPCSAMPAGSDSKASSASESDAPYRPGRRRYLAEGEVHRSGPNSSSRGYVPSTASSKAVGSLVLGYYDKGKLVHVGRVGTGFTQTMAREISGRSSMRGRHIRSPFDRKLSADARRGVRWVKPELVAEIEFRGWTHDGSLRHASFKGLREDKEAKDVVREIPKGAARSRPSRNPATPSRQGRQRRRRTAVASRSRALGRPGHHQAGARRILRRDRRLGAAACGRAAAVAGALSVGLRRRPASSRSTPGPGSARPSARSRCRATTSPCWRSTISPG